jgi:serine-type D-Ala-D-Ala carboxypeptidase (penicillin-binding protein 5/6)
VAVFALGGALGLAIPEVRIGPWRPAPAAHVAFDAGSDPLVSLWRVELAGTAADRAALDGGARSVARFHALVDEVPRRFDQALRAGAQARGPSEGRAEGCGDARADERADARAEERADARADARAEERADARAEGRADARADARDRATAPASDAAGEPERRRELTRLESALQGASDLIRGRARVETCVAGALIARSQIAISGDTESWMSPRASRAAARSHADSVAIALHTCHAWARLVAVVVRCGTRLAVLGVPDFGIAALLETWRFLCAATRR